ncbi:MAG: methyl-accepting chemotaxis protein, partial [Firmicutes bacterium]|nr:methyl-accepting chemotaxis protein [Bacillota bacterium]
MINIRLASIRRRSLGTKLALGYAAVIAALVISGVLSFTALTRLDHGEHRMAADLDAVYRVGQIRADWNRLRMDGAQYALDDAIGQHASGLNGKIGLLKNNISSEVRRLMPGLSGGQQAELRAFVAQATRLEHNLQQMMQLADAGQARAARQVFQQGVLSAGQRGEQLLGTLNQQLHQQAFTRQQTDHAYRQRVTIETGVVELAAILFGILVAIALIRAITRPLLALTQAAQVVGNGDLTTAIPVPASGDELETLARAFATMVGNLRRLIETVNESVQTVAAHSEELAAMAEEAASATQQVATAVGEITQGTAQHTDGVSKISRSMTELRQAIDQVATGARAQADHVQKATAVVSETAESIRSTDGVVHDVVSAAERMRQAAAEGAEKVAETLTGIQEVHSTILRTAEAIEALESDSAQIHQIVQTIREMADQINLLSLNANIEAARAGEHGKGFAVVADEVRQLAERSREATQQVVRLVDTIRQGTQAAVLAMREATASGEQGQQ